MALADERLDELAHDTDAADDGPSNDPRSSRSSSRGSRSERRRSRRTSSRTSGSTTFTKVTIDAEADAELTKFFMDESPWDRWFNVISPVAPIVDLRDDLVKLAQIRGGYATR